MRALLVVMMAVGWTGPAAAEVVETRRGLTVYKSPKAKSSNSRGRVLRRARFEVLERAEGKGCRNDWIRISPRGWICSTHTRVTDEPAGGPVWPPDKPGTDLPHTYVVTQDAVAYPTLDDAVAGQNSIALPGQGGFKYRGARSRDGKRFVKIDSGWVPADQARVVRSVGFSGVELSAADRGKRLAFVGPRRARVYDDQGKATGERIDAQHYLGEVGDDLEAGGKKLVALGKGRYLRRRDLSLLTWPAAPKVGSDERWIDVDMTAQVLVAYRGTTPVRATLVSTARTATPVGEFRIEKKRPYSRMRSKPHYRTKWDTHAPWVISVKGRIAIHAVYWHQDFGRARSQGCVNVAPGDAAFLWSFTEPALPPGWVRIETDARDKATLVRIRRSGR